MAEDFNEVIRNYIRVNFSLPVAALLDPDDLPVDRSLAVYTVPAPPGDAFLRR